MHGKVDYYVKIINTDTHPTYKTKMKIDTHSDKMSVLPKCNHPRPSLLNNLFIVRMAAPASGGEPLKIKIKINKMKK